MQEIVDLVAAPKTIPSRVVRRQFFVGRFHSPWRFTLHCDVDAPTIGIVAPSYFETSIEQGTLRMPSLEIPLPSNTNWLMLLSNLSTPVIVLFAILHLLAFFWLWGWAHRDLKRMLVDFDRFTQGLKHRSAMSHLGSLSDQIDGFLADVRDVLEDPAKSAERESLHTRLLILDEERRYLQSQSFETAYNVCRSMIEAYPIGGILGTILAIGAALQLPTGAGAETAVSQIVRYFGDAIWSTFAGLNAALVLMLLNSFLETKFRRLGENRAAIRDTVIRAKRVLSLSSVETQS